MSRPPLPPFTEETATQKCGWPRIVRIAETQPMWRSPITARPRSLSFTLLLTVPSSRTLVATGVNFTPSHFAASGMETGIPGLGGKVSGLILPIHVAARIPIE
jgi:hypothetical protein